MRRYVIVKIMKVHLKNSRMRLNSKKKDTTNYLLCLFLYEIEFNIGLLSNLIYDTEI